MSLVKVENLIKDYKLPKKKIFGKAPVFRALDGISLSIEEGESFGVVGESGCGKSTLARIVMALDTPTAGTVYYNDIDLFSAPKDELRQLRKHFQMVFQDPYSSLNPRKKVISIVSEPLEMLEKSISGKNRIKRVESIMEEVGLNPGDIDKYPHEFSGGQRQRIAIARALITKPSLIVADESVSALDVSVQAQVLNLMMDLQEKYNLSFLFISHDLSVVEYITQKLAVIYLGKIVEVGTTAQIFKKACHPYTRLLFSAIPSVDPDTQSDIKKTGTVNPEPKNSSQPLSLTPWGCAFLDRCPFATKICMDKSPELEGSRTHRYACHNV